MQQGPFFVQLVLVVALEHTASEAKQGQFNLFGAESNLSQDRGRSARWLLTVSSLLLEHLQITARKGVSRTLWRSL